MSETPEERAARNMELAQNYKQVRHPRTRIFLRLRRSDAEPMVESSSSQAREERRKQFAEHQMLRRWRESNDDLRGIDGCVFVLSSSGAHL